MLQDIIVVRVRVGRDQATVTPVLAAEIKKYCAYPRGSSPGPTDICLHGEGDRYAVLRDASLAREIDDAA